MGWQDDVTRMIQDKNLSMTDGFEIEGPWAYRSLHEMRAPIHIFVPGVGKVQIGEAIVSTDHGMKFEVNLMEEYKDVKLASFVIPMRFTVKPK